MSPCFCFIRVRNLAASFPNSSAWPSQGIIPLSRGGSFLRLQKRHVQFVIVWDAYFLKFSSHWKYRSSSDRYGLTLCVSRRETEQRVPAREAQSTSWRVCMNSCTGFQKLNTQLKPTLTYVTSHYEIHNYSPVGV